MSSSFERFLAGEDRLAALLRALPAFAPPASLEASFLASAHTAQASVGAASGREFAANNRSHENQSAQRPSPSIPLPQGEREASSGCAVQGFEPPVSLETSFLKMAASIDAAQASRREAILAQIAKGDSPQAALGADLQPATAEWLQQRARPATPAKPGKPARKPVLLGFSWFDLRLAALALILSAVGTRLVLKHQPDTQQLAVQEAFRSALESPPPATTESDLAQAAERSLAEAQNALDRANALNPQRVQEKARARPLADVPAEAGKEAKRASAADPAAEIGPPAHLVAPAPASVATGELSAQPHADSLSANPAPSAAPMAPVQAGSLERSVTSASPAPLIKEEISPRRERALGEAAPEELRRNESPRLAAKKSAAATDKERAELRQPSALPPMTAEAAAPAPAAVAPGLSNATPATPLSIRTVFTANLSDAPAGFASTLPARPAGQIWRVYVANPERPELQRWLETLRQNIPSASRPERFQLITEKLPPDSLRIVLPPVQTPATR